VLAKLSRLLLIVAALAFVSRASYVLAADEAHGAAAAHGEAGAHGAHEHIGTANASAWLEKPEEIKSDLAFFTFVVFMLLLAILSKFAWGPIVAALEKREEKIAHDISEAKRANEEAKQLLAQYEAKLATAANEVREMLEEARRDAEHAKLAILAEAKVASDAERARVLHDIEVATDQALESLAHKSAQLAVDLAGKILQSKLSSADHAKLISEAMAKFPTATPSTN